MLIINGGMPRSGTVLVGNLIRLMLDSRGIAWRRYNPQERRDLPEFLDLVGQSFEETVIVHTHLIEGDILKVLQARNDAVLIWNHRDPRDALVSLRQLHDLTFEQGIEAMRIYCSATEIAHTSAVCLRVRYEELVDQLPAHIQRLAQSLGLDLVVGELDALIEGTSPSAHSGIMHRLRAGSQPGAKHIQTKRRVLREDTTTLVNDRHIQSGKSGRWKQELTPQEQRKVSKALSRWIRLFGYDRTGTP